MRVVILNDNVAAAGETFRETLQKTREKIISSIKENPDITTNELAQIAEITVKGIEYQLNQLKKQNIIKRIGPDKGGHWEIVE